MNAKSSDNRINDRVPADNSLRSRVRRLVPRAPRQFASALARRVLGSHWKSIGFRHIDQTPLSAVVKTKLFEPELKLLPLFISNPGVVFDVGANIGEYTYVLEKAVGSEHVYAIEPLSQLNCRLKSLFPKVHIFKMALSDAPGLLTLKTPIVNGTPLLTRSTLERFTDDGETGALFEEVPVLTLDALCEQLQIRDVRLIKIDVEGHEKRVLSGARKILQACHPTLLVEIEQRHHAEPISEIFSWLRASGYYGQFFDGHRMSLRSIEDFSIAQHQRIQNLGSPHYINNFFFFDARSPRPTIDIAQPHEIQHGILAGVQ